MTRTISPAVHAARLIDDGDMLGPSLGLWKGKFPGPRGNEDEMTQRLLAGQRARFERDLVSGFVPFENMVRSAVNNVCDHVLGSEPTWSIAGDGNTKTLSKRAEAALAPVWNEQRLHTVLQSAVRTRVRDGEGALRIRIPRGAVARAASARGLTAVDAVRLLRVEPLSEPERLTVWEDEDTLTLRATYQLDRNRHELARIDDQGYTVLELIEGDTATLLWRMNLGGRLPYILVSGAALVTQGMLDMQSGANLIVTSATNNSQLAGQVMEHFHNLNPQLDAEGNPMPTTTGPGGELFTSDTIALQRVIDGNDEKTVPVVMKGSYQRHGPVSSEALEFNLRVLERAFYAEACQRHYLMGADATSSGEARKTSMTAFFRRLSPFRADAVHLIRGTLETLLAMAGALANQSRLGEFAQLRVEPTLTDRLSDPTSEDRRVSLEEFSVGIKSKQTVRAELGILSSEAEDAQIATELAATQPVS